MTSTVTSRSTANAAVRAQRPATRRASRRREPSATSVSQKAARSASAWARDRDDLRLLDEPHDAGERGALPRARHLDAERAGPFTVPAITWSPGSFVDRRDSRP